MMMYLMDRVLRVTHAGEMIDFNADLWNYFWSKRSDGVVVLRLEKNKRLDLDGPAPGPKDSFEWVEYGPPASIELIIFD